METATCTAPFLPNLTGDHSWDICDDVRAMLISEHSDAYKACNGIRPRKPWSFWTDKSNEWISREIDNLYATADFYDDGYEEDLHWAHDEKAEEAHYQELLRRPSGRRPTDLARHEDRYLDFAGELGFEGW